MAELVHIQIFYQRCEAAGALKYTQLMFAILVMWEISSWRDGKATKKFCWHDIFVKLKSKLRSKFQRRTEPS
jgi:hypothetical protein